MDGLNLVLVTGLSGSGKTTVAKAFEDLGFWCVDNLPAPLLESFVHFAASTAPAIAQAAVVMDGREGALLEEVPPRLASVADHVGSLTVLFLECSDETLVRRYREVRRSHPRDRSSIADGVAALVKWRRDYLASSGLAG